jgi:uncharacterized protein YfbU (UPF0304 family)
MKYLKTFNESVFEGEDFLYKEMNRDEFKNLEWNRPRIVPDEITMNKIYDIISKKISKFNNIDKSLVTNQGSGNHSNLGYYKFTIFIKSKIGFRQDFIHDDKDIVYIHPLEDEWYLVEYSKHDYENDDYLSHFYVCDGFDGLTELVDKEIVAVLL